MKNKDIASNEKPNNNKESKDTAKSFFTRKIHFNALKLGASILILGGIAIGIWQLTVLYHGKILPKVTIAGIKVGGKTPVEAKKIVNDYTTKLNTSGPEISFADQNLKPKLDEMGVTFNNDQIVEDAYRYGRNGRWFNIVKENVKMAVRGKNIEITPVVNEPKMDEYLGQLATVVDVAPANAGLQIDASGVISPVAATVGRGLDKNKLKGDLKNLINKNKLSEKIVLVTSELQPDVLDIETNDAQKKAESYMQAAPITVTFEDQAYIAGKGEIGSWIDFAPNGGVLDASLNKNKISGFANGIASRITIQEINREVMEGTGQVLVEGQDGRGVNTDELFNEIYKRVLSSATGAAIAVGAYPIPKGETVINPHAQPGRYAGRYIDINLSEQMLYAFEGSTLVNQFLVSTGTSSHPTPTGEYSVYGKSRVTTMDGPGYSLPGVEWVSWWSGDYSIHGTYWHSNFGNTMSHGCVNASNGDAEWIYNWDDIGTPVYVHY